MPQNLPLNLNNSGLSKPQSSVHAQNFSTLQLQQKKDILNAKTSVGKAMKKNNDFGPTSSISRIGQTASSASTSVGHGSINSSGGDDEKQRDEIRDRLRYNQIRQMMKDKKNNTDDNT